jgi:Tol biopolymer transport system component
VRRLLALLLMAAFGFSVYRGLGALRSSAAAGPQKPTATATKVNLPGTLFLVQQGGLYRLRNGSFTQLKPGVGSWHQPAVSPDRSGLVIVGRTQQSSDLYLLDLNGNMRRKLTDNQAARGAPAYWAFYPRFGPDGATIFYSQDAPKFPGDFKVDFAIWSMAADGSQRNAKRRSTPNDYTGGDTYPIPLVNGGLLYSKYSIGDTGPYSELWYQARALSAGKALTQAADNCGQPALSPDGSRVAMVCTSGKQTPRLVVAAFDPAGALGPPQVLVEGQLCASPAWSPDGRTVAFLAAAGVRRHFQLWTIAVPSGASPGAAPGPAKQLTQDQDFDATSAPAWIS